ncbi:MAG TPA: hypothetical protein PLP15_07340, partial [Bacilli bacterium]|nr:hypothetical protein [Bacilli bacterium]
RLVCFRSSLSFFLCNFRESYNSSDMFLNGTFDNRGNIVEVALGGFDCVSFYFHDNSDMVVFLV